MKDKPQGYAHLTAEIDSLQEQLRLCNVDQFSTAAELAAAQADAKRYRWLRGDKRGRSLSVSSLEWTGNAELSDAAVDAAMKECGK
jgi:hypothetical protein